MILFDFETVACREFSHTCCAICLLKGLLLLHFQLFGLIIRFAFWKKNLNQCFFLKCQAWYCTLFFLFLQSFVLSYPCLAMWWLFMSMWNFCSFSSSIRWLAIKVMEETGHDVLPFITLSLALKCLILF